MLTDTTENKYRILAEINMVPLIDVALVLLIIFMVLTPILVKSQIKLNLPKAHSFDEAARARSVQEIQITREGAIFSSGRPIALADLAAELRLIFPQPDQQTLFIAADKDVAFEHVVTVMDRARLIGVSRISVGIKPMKRNATL